MKIKVVIKRGKHHDLLECVGVTMHDGMLVPVHNHNNFPFKESNKGKT